MSRLFPSLMRSPAFLFTLLASVGCPQKADPPAEQRTSMTTGAASQPASRPASQPAASKADIAFEAAFGAGLLKQPIGIAALSNGTLAVSDAERNVIEVFSASGKHLRTLNPTKPLERPMHLAAVGESLWVAEYAADQVAQLSLTGERAGERIGPALTGGFDAPGGVAVSRAGTKYIADFYHHQIVVVSPAGKVTRWGRGKSERKGQPQTFTYPTDVALSVDESVIYIADAYAHRVRAYSPQGVELRSWGGHGSAPGQFNVATGVSTCGAGNVYVADFENNRVQVFNGDGELQAMFGAKGTGDGEFDRPTDVAVIGNKLFVVDYGNHRVQRFVWR